MSSRNSLDLIETRGGAQNLLPAVCDFCFWNSVLEEINNTKMYLQVLGISFEKRHRAEESKDLLNVSRNELVEKH